MNELQKLIKLRGMTVRQLSSRIGHGYHSTQKVVKGARYRLKSGTAGIYTSPAVRRAVAEHLGLLPEQVWGTGSARFLRRLIRQEIRKKTDRHERSLVNQYLDT